MLSTMLTELKQAAVKTMPTNAERLAEWQRGGRMVYAREDAAERAQLMMKDVGAGVAGAGLMLGAMPGLGGLAYGAGVAALSGTSVVAGVGTGLAGVVAGMAALGTVAVGSVVLPTALVAAVGMSVAGACLYGSGLILPQKREINSRERDLQSKATIDGSGRDSDSLSIKNWVIGAKNYITQAIGESLFGAKEITRTPQVDVARTGTHSGTVLAIQDGFVIQKTGRGANDITRHDLKQLDKPPVVGVVAEIAYDKSGQGRLKDRGMQQER